MRVGGRGGACWWCSLGSWRRPLAPRWRSRDRRRRGRSVPLLQLDPTERSGGGLDHGELLVRGSRRQVRAATRRSSSAGRGSRGRNCAGGPARPGRSDVLQRDADPSTTRRRPTRASTRSRRSPCYEDVDSGHTCSATTLTRAVYTVDPTPTLTLGTGAAWRPIRSRRPIRPGSGRDVCLVRRPGSSGTGELIGELGRARPGRRAAPPWISTRRPSRTIPARIG